MRKIIPLLFALLALASIVAVTGLPNTDYASPEYNMTITSSQAAFLDDNWQPESFKPPVLQAAWPDKNKVLANTSPEIYNFLNDNWTSPPLQGEVNTAAWPDKTGNLSTSGYAIYDFLNDNWNPSTYEPLVFETGPYKLREMS